MVSVVRVLLSVPCSWLACDSDKNLNIGELKRLRKLCSSVDTIIGENRMSWWCMTVLASYVFLASDSTIPLTEKRDHRWEGRGIEDDSFLIILSSPIKVCTLISIVNVSFTRSNTISGDWPNFKVTGASKTLRFLSKFLSDQVQTVYEYDWVFVEDGICLCIEGLVYVKVFFTLLILVWPMWIFFSL